MKILISLSFVLFSGVLAAATTIHIATFDSGFGGFFTAKAIESVSREMEREYDVEFQIDHFGDTKNAPYGSRTPEDIAKLSAKGIATAFDHGADHVFIACNTASTQFHAIKNILRKSHPKKAERSISIIEASVRELKKQIDEQLKKSDTATVAILATPATIKAGTYVRALAEAYQLKVPAHELKSTPETTSGELMMKLADNKRINLQLFGPAEWVALIETGAPAEEQKKTVERDLRKLSTNAKWDIVAQFCTHFPAIEPLIREKSQMLGLTKKETSFIAQGPLMAGVFRELMKPLLPAPRKTPAEASARARIFISGENVEATKALSREIFEGDPVPEVSVVKFQ